MGKKSSAKKNNKVNPKPIHLGAKITLPNRNKIVQSPKIDGIPGISKLLTIGEIDRLIIGQYGEFHDFAQQDPFFYAVRGESKGTVVANSKGSVLLEDIKIKLGTKFDYRL